MTGPLVEFIDYIAESAEWNEDLIDFYVFHIAEEHELPHIDPSDPDSPVFDEKMVRLLFFVDTCLSILPFTNSYSYSTLIAVLGRTYEITTRFTECRGKNLPIASIMRLTKHIIWRHSCPRIPLAGLCQRAVHISM